MSSAKSRRGGLDSVILLHHPIGATDRFSAFTSAGLGPSPRHGPPLASSSSIVFSEIDRYAYYQACGRIEHALLDLDNAYGPFWVPARRNVAGPLSNHSTMLMQRFHWTTVVSAFNFSPLHRVFSPYELILGFLQ
ncbi:hypothetical protein EVG20_g4327 [Dentipellis fragilis]|uniref:Uncharacterized protein n=1 Tax=Dentipellis fragilis TaxID=205917 RepID=A0A4Y9YYC4_9AGAM|nr:hypothetical protein EVG20_g4327 [Dentipellis fragilis]